ncbi:hypothetical protein NMP99_16625 [Glutamicibacter mishrai]|nr:hypothetical protein [Glutamicibacter mishrai]UTT39601.1 hypothetical protein NMP99_16625 [Glutamicibacter mishrai]
MLKKVNTLIEACLRDPFQGEWKTRTVLIRGKRRSTPGSTS